MWSNKSPSRHQLSDPFVCFVLFCAISLNCFLSIRTFARICRRSPRTWARLWKTTVRRLGSASEYFFTELGQIQLECRSLLWSLWKILSQCVHKVWMMLGRQTIYGLKRWSCQIRTNEHLKGGGGIWAARDGEGKAEISQKLLRLAGGNSGIQEEFLPLGSSAIW